MGQVWKVFSVFILIFLVVSLARGDSIFTCILLAAFIGKWMNLLAINGNAGRMPVRTNRPEILQEMERSANYARMNAKTKWWLLGDIIDTRILGIWSIGDLLMFSGFGSALYYFILLMW